MNEMLDRAIPALRSFECVAERQSWRVRDIREQMPYKVVFTCKDWAEAQAECDRLNARAVLVAIREPTKEVTDTGANAEYPDSFLVGEDAALEVWRAMIDEILKLTPADAAAASSP